MKRNPKMEVHPIIRQIIDRDYHHGENGRLYVDVMSGFTKTVTRPKRRLISSLTGKELVSLMRRHKVTIRELSERTKIPMKRIRELRESGIDDSFVLRDWMEAITGKDPGPMPRKVKAESESVCGLCGLPLRKSEFLFRWEEDVFCSLTCCENSGK